MIGGSSGTTAQASQGPNATNKAAFIRTGTAYLLADMMSALDRERPVCPTLFFNALLHANNGGMVMSPAHLAEFLKESSDVNPQLLLKVLDCSFSNFDRKDWDQWRQVVPLAADALIQCLKSAEALPHFTPITITDRVPSRIVHGGDAGVNAAMMNNDAAIMSVNGPKAPPQLLALAVGMAKSKLLMLEMPKRPVKVTVVVELQVNERRDDRNLLRAASETVHGTSLLATLVHDLQWLSHPVGGETNSNTAGQQQTQPLIQWRLVLADTDSSGAPTCSCADVARTALNTQVENIEHMSRIEIVECANILEAIQGAEEEGDGSSGSGGGYGTAKVKKAPAAESDVVVLFQNPAFCEQATQMGHTLHNLIMNDSSSSHGNKSTGRKGEVGPPLALLAENPNVDQNPVNVVLKTMMQTLLGVETGTSYRLSPGVCGFKMKYFLGMKKQWSAVVEHRRQMIAEMSVPESTADKAKAAAAAAASVASSGSKKDKKQTAEQQQAEKEKAEMAAIRALEGAKSTLSEDNGDLLFPNAPLARCVFFVASSAMYLHTNKSVSSGRPSYGKSLPLLELVNAVQAVKGTIRPVELGGTLTTWDVITPDEVLTALRLMGSLTSTFHLLPKKNDEATNPPQSSADLAPSSTTTVVLSGDHSTTEGDASAEGVEGEQEEDPIGALEARWENAFLSRQMTKDVWDHLLYDCSEMYPVILYAGKSEHDVVTKTAAKLSPEIITDAFTLLTAQREQASEGVKGM